MQGMQGKAQGPGDLAMIAATRLMCVSVREGWRGGRGGWRQRDVYIYTCIHVHAGRHSCIGTRTHACIQSSVGACVHTTSAAGGGLDQEIYYLSICLCMYVCMYVSIPLSIHPSIYLCVYIHRCIYIFICMYVCMYLCVCIYIYIYI